MKLTRERFRTVTDFDGMTQQLPQILYCHCTYANVVPREVKADVLRRLAESGRAFDAVADLCEMSAKKDPALNHLAQQDGLKIAACYPRAVQGLFVAAGTPLKSEGVEVLNMRTQTADEVASALLGSTDERKVDQI